MRKEIEIKCEGLSHEDTKELADFLPKKIGDKIFNPIAIVGNIIRGYIK